MLFRNGLSWGFVWKVREETQIVRLEFPAKQDNIWDETGNDWPSQKLSFLEGRYVIVLALKWLLNRINSRSAEKSYGYFTEPVQDGLQTDMLMF